MQRSHLEIYQRCATNTAYEQSSFRTEHDEQLNELQRQFGDKIRFFTQQTIGIIERHHGESDLGMKNIETSVCLLQKQLSDDQQKLSRMRMRRRHKRRLGLRQHQQRSQLLDPQSQSTTSLLNQRQCHKESQVLRLAKSKRQGQSNMTAAAAAMPLLLSCARQQLLRDQTQHAGDRQNL